MKNKSKKSYAVMTVGTSFFSQNNYFSKFKREGIDHLEWQKIILNQREQPVDLFNVPVSAEITVLRSCMKQAMFYNEPTEVHLIHSDTPDGISAVKGVGAYIETMYKSCKVHYLKISGLDMDNPKTMLQGLHELVRELNELFNRFKDAKDQVMFSPIGGYKTITMLGHLVAELNGHEAWYQFENSNVLTSVPRLPVKIDSETYKQVEVKEIISNFYCQSDYSFEEVLEFNTLSDELKDGIRSFPEVFHIVEDMVTFSPLLAGVLKKQAAVYFPKIYLKKAKDQQKKTELTILIRQLLSDWYRYKSSKESSQYYDILHHEVDWGVAEKETEFSLYRKKTSPEYRAVYRISDDRREIYLNEIWTDHAQYERAGESKMKGYLTVQFNEADYEEVPRELLKEIKSSY